MGSNHRYMAVWGNYHSKEATFSKFSELLSWAIDNANLPFLVVRTSDYDYASDTGVNPGFTKDECAALEHEDISHLLG